MTPDPFPNAPIPGPDPGACPDCGEWRKAGVIHRCNPDPFPNELVEWKPASWRLTYDGEHQADDYQERPSEFIIRRLRQEIPADAFPVRLYYLEDGWRHKLVQEWMA